MTTGQPEPPTDADLEWCYDAVHGVSRTFSITIDRLEEPMARHICLGYLLCRIADTIEDAGHIPPETQTDLLSTYDELLDPDAEQSVAAFMNDVEPWIPEERTDDWEVVAETPRVLRTFESLEEKPREIMREPVRELVDGMAMFTSRYANEGGLRLQTIEELEEYCWYAAGTVGTLITGLVARGTSQERAEEMRETPVRSRCSYSWSTSRKMSTTTTTRRTTCISPPSGSRRKTLMSRPSPTKPIRVASRTSSSA